MAILDIVKYASSVKRGHTLSLAQVKSDGGIRKAQKRGPNLFNFTLGFGPMPDNSDAYYGIENEIMNTFGYGVNTVSTQMSSVEVKNRGTWAGTPKINGDGQTGTTINLDGFTGSVTDIVKANDWLQFVGSTKVYQITEDASSNASGVVVVKLNTPIVGTISDNAVVTYGNAVEFNLALVNPNSVDPSKTPANDTYSLATWGNMILEEVL